MESKKLKIVSSLIAIIVAVNILPFNVLAQEVNPSEQVKIDSEQSQTEVLSIENGNNESEETEELENEIQVEDLDQINAMSENTVVSNNQNDMQKSSDTENNVGEDPLEGRANGCIDNGFYDSSELENETELFSMAQPQITHDVKFDNAKKRMGIDVSSYQGKIDWNKVKADGIEFAIIRVGYRAYESGTLGLDRYAIKNIEGASNAGIKVGVYIFSQAITVEEAQQEADYVISQVKKYHISLPIAMDYEYVSSDSGLTGRLYNANISKEAATAVVNAFCDRVQSRGYIGMVYANKNMLNEKIYGSEIGKNHIVWLANYTSHTNYAGNYSFWQFTSTGGVDGISGAVDMDVWYDNGTISNGQYSVCDGIYTLASRIDESMVLDISNGSKNNGGNVQLYKNNTSTAQRFKIHYIGNGYYTIQNINSGKVIDVSGGNGSNGTNIQQYSYNDSFSQKWIIKSTGDGYYKIISSINGKCLDVAAGVAKNSANIQLYSDNGSNAQKFRLKLIDCGQSLANGVYRISSKASEGKVLDIAGGATGNGANVQIYQNNGSDAQKWIVNYLGNGYYEISAFNSGKALDISCGGKGNGSNVQIYNENGTDAQKWIIRDAGQGYYYIITANSGNYLDIRNGDISNGQNVQMYSPNGSNAQKFKFISVASTNILAGPYYFESALNYDYVIDIAGGSKNNGANTQLYRKNGTSAQKYYLYGTGNGYYIIKSVSSGLVLDVAGGSKSNSANIQQYGYNGTNAQMWSVVPCGNGQYTFVNAGSGKCLEITFGSVRNGSNIAQYSSNRTGAQKFMLQATD